MDADDVALPFRSDIEEKAVKLGEFKDRNVTDVRSDPAEQRLVVDSAETTL
jgi:hypothetical protein